MGSQRMEDASNTVTGAGMPTFKARLLEGVSATLVTSGIDHAALAERIGNSDDNKR
jgi:hypothetical protein